MSEMIERVAAAIHKDSALEPGGPGILSLNRQMMASLTKATRQLMPEHSGKPWSTPH